MAKSQVNSVVTTEVTFTLTEDEARALDALAGYGTQVFLDTFYKHLGKHYLEPYEDGLQSLSENVGAKVGPALSRAEDMRKAIDKSNRESNQ